MDISIVKFFRKSGKKTHAIIRAFKVAKRQRLVTFGLGATCGLVISAICELLFDAEEPALPLICSAITLISLTFAFLFYRQARLSKLLILSQSELKKSKKEQKYLEVALHDDVKKYQGFFENALVGIWQIAPEGYWISANKTLASILGYASAGELFDARIDWRNQLFVNKDSYDD